MDVTDRELHPATVAIAAGRGRRETGQPMNIPVILASTFFASRLTDDATGREYARDDATAAWEALEQVVAELEAGVAAVAFSSGMAAIAAVLDLLPTAARIVAPTDSYTGVRALPADGQRQGRWNCELVDIVDTAAVLTAASGADLLWVETPTNPLLDIADLLALCAAMRAQHTRVVVDDTFATPLLQQPLPVGADIVVQSATKFIGGHSDLLLGVAATGDEVLAARLRERRMLVGATPGSLETYLALRGVRTMAVRIEQVNAARLNSPVAYPKIPRYTGCAIPASRRTRDMLGQQRR